MTKLIAKLCKKRLQLILIIEDSVVSEGWVRVWCKIIIRKAKVFDHIYRNILSL